MTSGGTAGMYTGVDNLEVMANARNYLRFLSDRIAQVAGPPRTGLRLLDFGAGTGTHAFDLRRRGYAVSCAEVDETLHARLAIEGFDVRRSPDDFDAHSFQIIYTMNVLEHIEDDEAALRALYRVLRPGGRLVVYVPALAQLYSSMDRKVGHLRRYHRRPLMQLVSGAGFEIDLASYVDSLGCFTTMLYKVVGSRKGDISPRAVTLYDRAVFPVSRAVDRFTGLHFGKNLLLVARRPADDEA